MEHINNPKHCWTSKDLDSLPADVQKECKAKCIEFRKMSDEVDKTGKQLRKFSAEEANKSRVGTLLLLKEKLEAKGSTLEIFDAELDAKYEAIKRKKRFKTEGITEGIKQDEISSWFTVAELKAFCEEKGINAKGKKQDFVQAIWNFLSDSSKNSPKRRRLAN